MTEQNSGTLPNQMEQSQILQCTNPQKNGQISSREQPPGIKEQLYKCRLQELTQKARLPLPSYRTVQEHPSSMFRGSVEVDGEIFACSNTFSTKKAAEADAAKLALESISEKIKNSASKKMSDGEFPPIHEDRVFCKSILHEYATKKNVEKPTYDTVRVEGVVPLFISSLVFDGVKYTGDYCVNKKEAEQLAARAVILSVLANSEVDTILPDIVKSKAKQISAVHANFSVTQNSSVTHLLHSGGDTEASVIKERASDNVQQGGDMTRNVLSEELQQQSASKKARIPENAIESCIVTKNVSSTSDKLPSAGPLEHKFMKPNLETLPLPSLLPWYQKLPQPSFLPPPSFLQNSQTLPQPSLLPSIQTLAQPSLPPNIQTQSHSSLLPSTPIVLQPSSQSSFSISPHTTLQSSLLVSTQTLPQPSLPQNIQTQSQPILLPSTQIALQPNSQSSFPISTHTPLQSSLLTDSQTLPQPNYLPTTCIPSFDTQTLSNGTTSSRKRRQKKANKKAKNAMQMQASNVPRSQVPSCTIAQ